MAGLLIALCALSLAYYGNFGKFHVLPVYGPLNFHEAEVYTYYSGSKYFKETGYYDLYNCTSVGIREIKAEHPEQATPDLFAIMNLRDKKSYLSPEQVWSQYGPQCHQRFSPKRWDSFKKDLRVFLNAGSYSSWWRTSLSDAGYNSSPVFAAFAGTIANLLPIDRLWRGSGYIDFLLVAIAAFFIYRAFGFYPLMAFLLIFGTNELSSYRWTGGSFFRQAWFASLTVALCLLKQKKYFWSGVIFAYSAGDRVIPLLFFAGALVPLSYQWVQSKGEKREIISFAVGFAISLGVWFLLSVSLYDLGHWRDFFANMKVHNRPFHIPHVGLKKAMIYFKGISPQDFWYEEGLKRFNVWNAALEKVLQSRRIFYYPLALFLILGSLWVSRKKSPPLAALLVGGSLLYALLLPARYYYVYLALFPVVSYEFPSTFHNNIRLFLSFFLVFALLVIPMLPPDDIVLNIYFSYALGIFFSLQILTAAFEECVSLRDKGLNRVS